LILDSFTTFEAAQKLDRNRKHESLRRPRQICPSGQGKPSLQQFQLKVDGQTKDVVFSVDDCGGMMMGLPPNATTATAVFS
jgi:hypothetical protein